MPNECKKLSNREQKWEHFLKHTDQGRKIELCIRDANPTWVVHSKKPNIGSRISSLFQEDSDHHHSACYKIGKTKEFAPPADSAPQIINMLKCIASSVGLNVIEDLEN